MIIVVSITFFFFNQSFLNEKQDKRNKRIHCSFAVDKLKLTPCNPNIGLQ